MNYWQTQSMDMQNREQDPKRRSYYLQEKERTLQFLQKYFNKTQAHDIIIADWCCGTGRVTEDLLSFPQISTVHAIDINPESLATLNVRLQHHPNISKLHTVEADVIHPSIPLPHCNAIIVLESLVHLENLEQALRNIFSSLSPHGIVIGNVIPKEWTFHWRKKIYGSTAFMVHGIDLTAKFLARSKVLHPLLDRLGLLRSQKHSRSDLQTLLTKVGFHMISEVQSNGSYWFVAQKRSFS